MLDITMALVLDITQDTNNMKTTTKPKMGRPTVYKQAMTQAERQQRYRDRIKREADELLKQVKLY